MIKIILTVLFFLILLILVSAWFFAAFVMTGRRQTLSEAMDWQTAHYDTAFYKDLEKTDYTISGADNYTLHVELLKNPKPTGEYMILSHGYTDNRIGSLKYVKMYLDLGFNCIIYDLRGHGENERTFTSYGILEARDLLELIRDTRKRYPELTRLGLHGESLGAATTVTVLKYKPEVDFAVADCGFSDIENVLRGAYKSFHVPSFLFDLGNLGAGLRYRYTLKEMRPIESLTENHIPILFIHGADDTFILPQNSQDMYDRTLGIREFHLIDGAGHVESILTDPIHYREFVGDFLMQIP